MHQQNKSDVLVAWLQNYYRKELKPLLLSCQHCPVYHKCSRHAVVMALQLPAQLDLALLCWHEEFQQGYSFAQNLGVNFVQKVQNSVTKPTLNYIYLWAFQHLSNEFSPAKSQSRSCAETGVTSVKRSVFRRLHSKFTDHTTCSNKNPCIAAFHYKSLRENIQDTFCLYTVKYF